jgi:hypothetical protein
MPLYEFAPLMAIFGEDGRFWVTVFVASFLKWLFTPNKKSLKEAVSGLVAGAASAYYGTDYIIRSFDSLTTDDRDIVVIALVFTGEHIMRLLVQKGPQMLQKKLGLTVDGEDK